MGFLRRGGSNDSRGEPATPITRTSIHPKHNHVIHCAIGFKNPINIATLKDDLSNSIMIKIPRFSSLLVVNSHDETEHWVKTHVNLDDHIIIHHAAAADDDDDDDDAINSYLADIAISPPMSLDKPLWEVHILHGHKCLILRVHHAVADGTALMSLLWTMGRSSRATVHDVEHHHHENCISYKSDQSDHAIRDRKSVVKKLGLFEYLMLIWFNLVAVFKYMARCLCVKDKETLISGIDGVELWPRKVTTARFTISDMKTVKNAIPNATINDVVYGALWCGLTRYFKVRHFQTFKDGAQITGLLPVNIREEPGIHDLSTMLSSSDKMKTIWGNKFAMVLLPVTYYMYDWHPLTYIARAKAIMYRKKRSMEAHSCYNFGRLIFALFGSKVGGDLFYNLFSNTSFLLSNMLGPQEEISIFGNPVSFIRVTSSGQPHAITLHMVSYVGKADLQIQVAKDVIPDPEFLAKCIEDAIHEMKEATHKCVAANSKEEISSKGISK